MRAGLEKSQAVSISLRRCEVMPVASTNSSEVVEVVVEADDEGVAITYLLVTNSLVTKVGEKATCLSPTLIGY